MKGALSNLSSICERQSFLTFQNEDHLFLTTSDLICSVFPTFFSLILDFKHLQPFEQKWT